MTGRGIQSTSFVIQSVSSVIQSEAKNLFLVLLRVRFLTVFGMTGRGIQSTSFVIQSVSSVIQSEAMNLFPFPGEIPHGVRNDKVGHPRSETRVPCT
ncbi:hypothetical protein [Tannerella forsythia]|uniref:hypothetical protein n=1 Tax=Tannerella forsythia TaxID=28112 RepID=UPI001C54F165|nr:hypothetical protein [Tannerella forsythia]